MTDEHTATIIAFPCPPQPVSEAETPDMRLDRALQSLNAALAAQRTAVAEWRAGLDRLRSGVASLSGSLQRYQVAMSALDAQVKGVGEQARRLDTTAGGMIAAN